MLDASWEALKRRLWQQVWAVNPVELSRPGAGLLRAVRIGHMLIRELGTGQLTLRAMSLVYTTLLSLVPLLAVSFSVLKGFGVHNQLEPALLGVLAPLGEKAAEIAQLIVGFVENVQVGLLGAMGLALLLYTVISLLQKVEHAFNYTWRVVEQRGLGQRFSDYLSVLLVGPLLVFAAMGLTATLAGSSLGRQLLAAESVGWLLQALGALLPFVFVTLAFTFIYLYLPNTRVRLRPAVTGALVAGALWQLVGWVFAAFVVSATKTTAIYSSFAILVIFMMWLYLAWLILLVGASVAFYCQHPEYLGLLVTELGVSVRMKERLALQCAFSLAQRHYYGLAPVSMLALADQLRVPVDPIREVLAALAARGIVVAARDGSAYVPGRDLALITVEEVLEVVRSAGESPYLNQERLATDEVVDRLVASLEHGQAQVLDGRTLRELAAAHPPAGQEPTDPGPDGAAARAQAAPGQNR